jgi:hypothetical protein
MEPAIVIIVHLLADYKTNNDPANFLIISSILGLLYVTDIRINSNAGYNYNLGYLITKLTIF